MTLKDFLHREPFWLAKTQRQARRRPDKKKRVFEMAAAASAPKSCIRPMA